MIRPLRPRRIAPLVSLFAAGVFPALTGAQDVEEILAYDVTVDVRPGGSLVVSERIRVRALGQEIQRGVYRDVPTSFPRSSGLGRIEAPFEVLRVLRDGQPEPYTVLSIGGEVGRGGVRVRAGQSDVFLDPGVYEYTFEYLTDRWVRFGEAEDQLYWNVTGNRWSFPIRSATARVRIGELEVEPGLEAWTGPEGSTDTDVEFSWGASNREAGFRATQGLASREGLTVRLTFPSGHLSPPSEAQRAEWFAVDWGGYVDAGYLVLLVVAVYLLMWRRVGMDPAAGPTPLRRDPPPGFSPAALSYLEERGYRVSQFAAALVNMAMKGAIRIERHEASWTLHKESADADLAQEERAAFEQLLGTSSTIDLEQSQHATVRAAIKSLKRSLSRQLEREYFFNNRRWLLAGLGVSVLGLAALAWRWRFGIEPTAWFLGLWLTGWTAGVATMVTRIFQMVRFSKKQPIALAGALGLSVFSIPFIGAEIAVAGWLTTLVPTHLVLATVLVAGTNVGFYHLLERPTLRGRGVLDHLEGFKAYLSGTESGPAASDQGVQHFEGYLPHAIALGIEERWAGGFGGALTLGAQPAEGYVPHWYSHDAGHFDASSFASSLGSSLSSTISAASSLPSSGRGGGGSSGGGGGGGGGGGW
jgi:uncharacterized membrane protein YgcG